jgi:hypothetical protein
MTNVYFAMYKFKVRRKGTRKTEENYLTFDTPLHNNLTLMDIIREIFVENTFVHDNLRVTNQIDFDEELNSLTGLLDLGEYGNLRKVFNRDDEDWEDEIDENKIVCDPFLFRIEMPQDTNEGFITLEKKKSRPFTTTFFKCIKEKIKEDYEDCISIDTAHIIPREAEPLFNNSEVLEFIFIKNQENEEQTGDNQLQFRRSKLILDVRNNNFVLTHVREEGFLNTLKTMIPDSIIYAKINRQDDKQTTVNLEDIYENKMFYLDITDELNWEDGNPEYNRIKLLAEYYTRTNFDYHEVGAFDNDPR